MWFSRRCTLCLDQNSGVSKWCWNNLIVSDCQRGIFDVFKIQECPNGAGIISSYQTVKEGFLISCYNDNIRYWLIKTCIVRYYEFPLFKIQNFIFRYGIVLKSGTVFDSVQASHEWYHLVLNFINPGIVVYHDGVQVVNTGAIQSYETSEGLGLVVIGRYEVFEDDSTEYTSLMMDELMFFNRKLTLEEIQILHNL